MTMYSPDKGGDSFIAGMALVDILCEVVDPELEVKDELGLCSYTQDFYGNENGTSCNGKTSRELLEKLLV